MAEHEWNEKNTNYFLDKDRNEININDAVPPICAMLWIQTPITISDAHLGDFDDIRIRPDHRTGEWVIERGVDSSDENWPPNGYVGTVWIEECRIPANREVEDSNG